MTTATSTVTVRLSPEARQRLDRLAKNTSRSKSWLAADAISLYLDTQEWQIGEIESGIRDADMENFAPVDELAAFFTKWSDGS